MRPGASCALVQLVARKFSKKMAINLVDSEKRSNFAASKRK